MIHLNLHEKIISVRRKSWWHCFFALLPTLILMILPIVGSFYIPDTVTIRGSVIPIGLQLQTILFLLSAWVLALWMHAAWIVADHYLDTLIITNDRVMRVETKNFLKRSIISLPFAQVAEIAVEPAGVAGKPPRSGEIRIASAGAMQSIVFGPIRHPERLVEQLRQAREVARKNTDAEVVFNDELDSTDGII